MIDTPAVPDPGLREQLAGVNAKLDLIAGDVTEAGTSGSGWPR